MSPEALSLEPLWSQTLASPLSGLSLAREKNWVLVWDQKQWLTLLDQAGQIQAQTRFGGPIAQCALADDGSGAVAVGQRGEVRWLAPDLTIRWERNFDRPQTAAAVAPFGDFFVCADAGGIVRLYSGAGVLMAQSECSRPLQHLAFVPGLLLIVGCADYGLVGALDQKLSWKWRESLVVNAGALSVNADASSILLACFSDGLHRFAEDGNPQPRLATPEPSRLVSQTFAGDLILSAGMEQNIFLLTPMGQVLARYSLPSVPRSLMLGPLGQTAFVALADGSVIKYHVKRS